MWLFLTEAILGALMGLYTFFIPHRTRDLIPTIGWLYTVYVNASICSYLNLQTPVILAIGIIIIGCCFGLAIWNTKRSGFIKQIKANSNSQNHEDSSSLTAQFHNFIHLEIFKPPWIYLVIACIISTYFITIYFPATGTLIALIPWYFIPLFYFFHQCVVNFQKTKTEKRILLGVAFTFIIFAIFLVFLFES